MEIRTDRLLLREFVAEDWRAVLRYQSDPLYLRFYPLDKRSASDARAFVQIFLDQQRVRPRIKYQLAIVLPNEDRLIGNVGIRKRTASAREADIGYELDTAYWGHGYATEAARAIVRFGFEQLALHRIWAECLADNMRSARVLERLGMQREGHLRENVWFKNRWWDTLIYAILEDEWRSQQR